MSKHSAPTSDESLVLGLMIAKRVRWEPYSGQTQRGELCFGNFRYGADLNEMGCPTVSDSVRDALLLEAFKQRGVGEAT